MSPTIGWKIGKYGPWIPMITNCPRAVMQELGVPRTDRKPVRLVPPREDLPISHLDGCHLIVALARHGYEVWLNEI